MTVAAVLCAITVLDGSFAGFRAAAGRIGRVDTAAWMRAGMRRGAAAGALALVAIGAGIGLVLATAPDPAVAFDDHVAAGRGLLAVYLPYGALALVAVVAHLVPKVDVRVVAMTLVLGPFTLARPVVVVAGALAGVLGAEDHARVGVSAAVATVAVLAVEPALDRTYRATPITAG